jgi:Family of unknown function (DUF5670)
MRQPSIYVRQRTSPRRILAYPSPQCSQITAGENIMLESIAVVLLILWALGLVTSYSLGGFIHVLLVIAVVMILIRVIQGRRIS